jgi:hypothetical protein
MQLEEPVEIQCPFCGETFTSFADPSVPEQSYIEDCQVCCRPIEFNCRVDPESGEVYVSVERST